MGYNEQPQNLYYDSPLYTLWRLRRADNPGCPFCSQIMMPNVLTASWLEEHPGYSPDSDVFLAMAAQTFAEGGSFNGLTTTDIDDLYKDYNLLRTAEELARGEGWVKVLLKLGSELGLPLLGAAGQVYRDDAQQAMALELGLWNVTRAGADRGVRRGSFTYLRSRSDGLWWSKDRAGHGQSAWKVYEETATGLQWIADADEYGDFITGKHKSSTGEFIPWNELSVMFGE